MNSTLERHKAFPFIAWATFLCFAGFTLYLALELKETAAYLDQKMDNNVEYLKGV
jgi:hypothetical protein